MAIFQGRRERKILTLYYIYSWNSTFVPRLSEIGDLSIITSCLILPGLLVDTLSKRHINVILSLIPNSFCKKTQNTPSKKGRRWRRKKDEFYLHITYTLSSVLARDCGKLPVPTNGSIIGKRTTYPNRLSFSCDEGFDLIGSIARRCEAGGNWSGQQPTCKGNILIKSKPLNAITGKN